MKALYGQNVHGTQVLPGSGAHCRQGSVCYQPTHEGGAKSTSKAIETLLAEAKELMAQRYQFPKSHPKAAPQVKWCKARHAEAWSVCLWGNPKMTVVCGNCLKTFSTRDYLSVTNCGGQIACKCDGCGAMNLTGLYPA